MKRTLFVTLSALALSLTTAPAFANEIAATNTSVQTNSIVEINPFDLVTRSYQGYFSDRGIPSNGSFVGAVNSRKVTSQDLVQAAIASGRLAPETLEDRAYLNAVTSHLRNLNND